MPEQCIRYARKRYKKLETGPDHSGAASQVAKSEREVLIRLPIWQSALALYRDFHRCQYCVESPKTQSQKKLNALQRRKNLEKAFCVTGDVRGKNILVIDDVYTTGSTIDAMAGCLKRKGAGNVYFLYGLHGQEITKKHFSYIMIYVTINLYDYMNDFRLLLRTE